MKFNSYFEMMGASVLRNYTEGLAYLSNAEQCAPLVIEKVNINK